MTQPSSLKQNNQTKKKSEAIQMMLDMPTLKRSRKTT